MRNYCGEKTVSYWKGNCDVFKAVSLDSPEPLLALMCMFSLVDLSLQIILDAFDVAHLTLLPLFLAYTYALCRLPLCLRF